MTVAGDQSWESGQPLREGNETQSGAGLSKDQSHKSPPWGAGLNAQWHLEVLGLSPQTAGSHWPALASRVEGVTPSTL